MVHGKESLFNLKFRFRVGKSDLHKHPLLIYRTSLVEHVKDLVGI